MVKNPQGGCETVNGFRSKKVLIDADLSFVALRDACQQFMSEFACSPRYLLTAPYQYNDAIVCAQSIGWGITVISSPVIKGDSWAVVGEEGCIWSDGA